MLNITITRSESNPILKPDPNLLWEAAASFNPSIVAEEDYYHVLYRAISSEMDYEGQMLQLSTIGHALSGDGLWLMQKRQFITPEHDWERFGCEDPRITNIDDEFLITYTAISNWPPSSDSIKVAIALSKDLRTIDEKHLVTPFNAKAMAFFPEKINGQYVAVVTVNTDEPPAKIALAYFDQKSDIWSESYWQKWYAELDKHLIPIQRLNSDQIEVGAVPVKTVDGWVLIYSHIQHYFQENRRIFGVEAVLLDLSNPQKIIGRTTESLFVPEAEYELNGMIKNVVFPSGAMIVGDEFRIYYGAADTTGAVISVKLAVFLSLLKQSEYRAVLKLRKYSGNPILLPRSDQAWQAQAVFNAGAIMVNNQTYILYRAMSLDNTSTIGCAISEDGYSINHVFHDPIYVPRMEFETKKRPNDFSGCEDPRVTQFGDKIYMFYTAYDGSNLPRVALTSILVDDFVQHRWIWQKPILISDPRIDDKNACLFPEKINDRYVILHRAAGYDIAIDYVDSLEEFSTGTQLEKEASITPRLNYWDSAKIGIAGPPIKTDKGWLLIYHGVSESDRNYRLGFLLLDLTDPFKVLYRTPYPILEPETEFERIGIVNNVVFSCGAVLRDGTVFVYYGGADKVMAVATMSLDELLSVV